MKSFTWKIVICVVPLLLGIVVVANSLWKYQKGEGGFNLGVDLVGGTILVYEVDESRWPDGQMPADYDINKLTAKLMQRIDPAGLYNITIRPLSKTRVEIILPTGGIHYAQHQQEIWEQLIKDVKDKWKPREGHESAYDVGLGQRQQLIDAVVDEKFPKTEAAGEGGEAKVKELSKDEEEKRKKFIDEVSNFIDSRIAPKGEKRKSMTSEQVQNVKKRISQQGSLQFLIVANPNDDREGMDAAKAYFDKPTPDQVRDLETAAVNDRPPLGPPPPDGQSFHIDLNNEKINVKYSWVELGTMQRYQDQLSNEFEGKSPAWEQMKTARDENKAVEFRGNLLYSRKVRNPDLLPPDQRNKKYEYFILCRDPEIAPDGRSTAVTGDYLMNAKVDNSDTHGIVVAFNFNSDGAKLLADLTTKNKERTMAIVLDGQLQSAANIKEPLTGGSGIIYGGYTQEKADQLVNILRSGALPATLKPQPVSENTMGATLGEDTIYWGTVSVLVAFVAILLFMLIYYRFAGIVACIALLGNLILTVAVMVLINATFTLPGIAGLVLMLGMAVDANVLIYERLREERERGASLALSIRNGYDRAFPTIIDTHLSSIFTAIVLYVVGNDQLKGFGITLTLGLIISLFTSLVMTRLMFDYWLSKGWLHKLSMMRLIPHTNINFMAIRYYWFTATIILTVLGASIFLWRLNKGGLNIDFMGGTAYTGLLKKPDDIADLRKRLDPESADNKKKLAIDKVDLLANGEYRLTYVESGNGLEKTRDVFVDKEKRPDGTIAPVDPDVIKKRAEDLPDLSIVQIFAPGYSEGDKSRFFTVRTQERAASLVQAAIGRLLAGDLEQILMQDTKIASDGKGATMTFNEYASPAQLSMLLTRQFNNEDVPQLKLFANQFQLTGVGKDQAGHYKEIKLSLAGSIKLLNAEKIAVTDAEKSANFTLSEPATMDQVQTVLKQQFDVTEGLRRMADHVKLAGVGQEQNHRYKDWNLTFTAKGADEDPLPTMDKEQLTAVLDKALRPLQTALTAVREQLANSPQPERLENFDAQLAADTQLRALYAILASWGAILLYLWFRFGSWTFGMAAVLCLIHDLFFTLGFIGIAYYIHHWWPNNILGIQDFKIDLNSVAALLTLVGYSVNDTIVVFDRIREVRGKNPELTPKMINDSVNQTLSRTLLTALSVWLVVLVLYSIGGEGVHLFAYVMVVGVIVGTYSSIYIASPLLLIFGEGKAPAGAQKPQVPQTA